MSNTSDSLRDLSDRALKSTETLLSKPMSLFGNSYLRNVVLVLLLLYAPVAAPTISVGMASILGNYAVKLVYIFLLAYLLCNSIRISIVTAVAITVGIFLIKKFRHEGYENVDETENREIATEPVVNRLEVTKPDCGDIGNVDGNHLDNVTEYNASADHEDAMKPQIMEDMLPVTMPSMDEFVGYDESDEKHSMF